MKELNSLHNKYLKEADAKEKNFFITALCRLASSDGKIKPEELQYIEELAGAAGIEIRPAFFNCPDEVFLEEARRFTNRKLALALLKHMFILAYTDNVFSDSEGIFICKISEVLNIEPDKVQEISSWVIDRIIWLEQAEKIFEEYE